MITLNECPIGNTLTHLPNQTLRIIDANLDRTTEGLRVLEDVARFVLDSSPLAARLKELRHRIHAAFPGLAVLLISARDSAGDVGRESVAVKEPAAGLIDTVTANARRVEQSLRVLEEVSRLPDTGFDGTVFEEARFAVYDIEKELISALSRRDKVARLAGLYSIVENEDELSIAFEQHSAAIQLNQGAASKRSFWRTAEDFRDYCDKSDTMFIVGECVDVAVAVKADGVALNVDSLPLPVARNLLGIDQVIGYFAGSLIEAVCAQESADFVLCSEYLRTEIQSGARVPVVTPGLRRNR